METNLREAKRKVDIEGILSSMNLEIGPKDEKDPSAGKVIKGSLSIKVDDINTISVGVYCAEKTNDGKENKAYAGLVTVKDEYKTIADVGEEAADRIHTRADFSTFRNQDGKDVVNYRSNFFSRVKGEFKPERSFGCETFIKAKNWETDTEGNETGRLKLKGIVPAYNGTINILELVCPASNEYDDTFAQDADNLFEVGQTYWIDGEIVNARVEKKKQAALGKLKSEVTFKNELIVVGSGDPYDEDSELAYNAQTIDLAITEYETTQKQNREKANNKDVAFTNKKPSAAASGRSLGF